MNSSSCILATKSTFVFVVLTKLRNEWVFLIEFHHCHSLYNVQTSSSSFILDEKLTGLWRVMMVGQMSTLRHSQGSYGRLMIPYCPPLYPSMACIWIVNLTMAGFTELLGPQHLHRYPKWASNINAAAVTYMHICILERLLRMLAYFHVFGNYELIG
jgi:hypothetical protein